MFKLCLAHFKKYICAVFFANHAHTVYCILDVYVERLNEEIINSLKIKTALPNMQQITLIYSVAPLSFSAPSPSSLLTEGFLPPVDSEVRTFS